MYNTLYIMRRGYFFLLKLLGTIVLAAVLLKAITFLPASKLSGSLADSVVFLQKTETNAEHWLGDFVETFRLVTLKRERNRQYEMLYKKQAAENALLQALTYDNNQLRDALRFQRNYAGSLIPAEIVGRSGDHWFRFVTADKGSRNGVRSAMIAVDTQGLVGYVAEAGQDSARVVLLTDPLVNISCVNERTGGIYVLTGKDSERLELKYATLHSDIREGDRLLTSGHSYRYKRGIPVGVVTGVDRGQSNLAKKVTVKPIADVSGLDIIFFVR
ncbi:rod shape-determining protein MreC [Candidatus Termititenax dinenymphae]|uniref:Cell shape-determining protein MreC n=1 Tax=Candidatus Termititenax dinenymphae TaxID=2218523 RepID=A0A388TL85_9BACT|nr:rod shape-determining protein MreC [Candidatus Termititenax dinenymphae]